MSKTLSDSVLIWFSNHWIPCPHKQHECVSFEWLFGSEITNHDVRNVKRLAKVKKRQAELIGQTMRKISLQHQWQKHASRELKYYRWLVSIERLFPGSLPRSCLFILTIIMPYDDVSFGYLMMLFDLAYSMYGSDFFYTPEAIMQKLSGVHNVVVAIARII